MFQTLTIPEYKGISQRLRTWMHLCSDNSDDRYGYHIIYLVYICTIFTFLNNKEARILYCDPNMVCYNTPGHIIPYNTQLYYTVMHMVNYFTVLYCSILYYTVLYCTVLYCTALYCTVLYCTVLYCTVSE